MHQRPVILVVDDNDEILDFLRLHLDRRGYETVCCRAGKEALKLVPKVNPDLILLDIMMPDMDGFKVCRALKDDPQTAPIPIIFLTAKTGDVDRLKGFEVGAEDYLVKPFRIHELISKLQIFLRIKTLIDRSEEKARRARALFEVGKLIASSLDLDEVLAAITRSTHELLEADSVSVMLGDGKQRSLEVSCTEGAELEPFRGQNVGIDDSIAGFVVKRGEPVIIDDIQNDPRFASFPHEERVKSAMITPLRHKGRSLGAINVSYLTERRIDAEQLQLLATLASQASLAVANARLVAGIHDAYLQTIGSLARAVDAKDSYTADHCENVANYSRLIALRLGLSRSSVEEIRVGGFLHDIGKIGIDDNVLKKPGKLDKDEFQAMKLHPVKGFEILKHAGMAKRTLDAVKHHHERMDGKGYPDGLAGDAIPLAARIVLVADAFDAMTTDRTYRKGASPEEAIAELVRHQDSQFDKRCVDALAEALIDRRSASSPERPARMVAHN